MRVSSGDSSADWKPTSVHSEQTATFNALRLTASGVLVSLDIWIAVYEIVYKYFLIM